VRETRSIKWSFDLAAPDDRVSLASLFQRFPNPALEGASINDEPQRGPESISLLSVDPLDALLSESSVCIGSEGALFETVIGSVLSIFLCCATSDDAI
jgi:hypothetical protein